MDKILPNFDIKGKNQKIQNNFLKKGIEKGKKIGYSKEDKVNLFYQGLSNTYDLLIGAFTFIAALAWNDAFTNYLTKYSLFKKYGLFFYAILVSTVAVLLSVFLNYYVYALDGGFPCRRLCNN